MEYYVSDRQTVLTNQIPDPQYFMKCYRFLDNLRVVFVDFHSIDPNEVNLLHQLIIPQKKCPPITVNGGNRNPAKSVIRYIAPDSLLWRYCHCTSVTERPLSRNRVLHHPKQTQLILQPLLIPLLEIVLKIEIVQKESIRINQWTRICNCPVRNIEGCC